MSVTKITTQHEMIIGLPVSFPSISIPGPHALIVGSNDEFMANNIIPVCTIGILNGIGRTALGSALFKDMGELNNSLIGRYAAARVDKQSETVANLLADRLRSCFGVAVSFFLVRHKDIAPNFPEYGVSYWFDDNGVLDVLDGGRVSPNLTANCDIYDLRITQVDYGYNNAVEIEYFSTNAYTYEVSAAVPPARLVPSNGSWLYLPPPSRSKLGSANHLPELSLDAVLDKLYDISRGKDDLCKMDELLERYRELKGDRTGRARPRFMS